MIKNFNSYESLFACEELDNGIREYIMSVADEFKYSTYTYGEDYEEIYVQVHSYYTKKGELIATVERKEGEYLLSKFNRCVVRDWEKKDIQKKVDELNESRINEIEKAFEYLENNNMSYELKKILRRDCFTVYMIEEKKLFGGEIVLEMRDKRFNVIYTCTFYESKEEFEEMCRPNAITPWKDDFDGKILNTNGYSVIGVAGELKKYFSTKFLGGKEEYKYAVTKIEKWYVKESGLTMDAIRREKKVKIGLFGF